MFKLGKRYWHVLKLTTHGTLLAQEARASNPKMSNFDLARKLVDDVRKQSELSTQDRAVIQTAICEELHLSAQDVAAIQTAILKEVDDLLQFKEQS